MQCFGCAGIDAAMLHESRREVAGIAGHPRRGEGAIARHHAEAFHIGQRAGNAQPQLVRERFELPRLAAAQTPGHQGIAPVQARRRIGIDVELLRD